MKANTVVEFVVIHYGWMNGTVLTAADALNGKVGDEMDREQVIKGLKICTTRPCYCIDCPYIKECCLDSQDLMEDALALLKEEEPVEPIKQIEQTEWTVCGNCRNHIISKWIFCPYCGKRVKWNE